MKVNEFKSKFGLNDLVEFDKDGKMILGKIKEVHFWQSDAVNYAAGYKIERANGEEIDTVSEQFVKKVYRDL